MPDEFGLSQLSPRSESRAFEAPNGIRLNATYLDFLRGHVPPARVRLRMKGELDPIVILLDGKPVGVMMAVKR
jgi:hypothetical protein